MITQIEFTISRTELMETLRMLSPFIVIQSVTGEKRDRGHSCHPKGTGIPSFVQFVVLNDEVRCVGDAEEVLGWKNNNGPSILWFR